MSDSQGEAAGQSQVQGCSSYPLSFPSQPPDIKNWFSSYEYDSPEAAELVADPGGHNGSETQDPLEHLLLKHAPRDGGVAVRENCLGGQFENEVFAGTYLILVDGSALKPAPKRKQSLRALFGVGFLDNHEDTTESESQVVLPVRRNALEPLSNCNVTGSPDTEESQEGAIEHSKVPVDCDGISSVDTQVSSLADQEVEYSTLAVDCDGRSLADIEKNFTEDRVDNIKFPIKCVDTNLANTDKGSQDGAELSILPVSHKSVSLADTENDSSIEEAGRCKHALEDKQPQETVASDGFVAIKRKERPLDECKMNKIAKHPVGREKGKLQENRNISEQKVLDQVQIRSPLADRTNFSEVAAAPTPGLSGKWKCPRKGKPYVGPPLKQLRLEQWVRRVN